MTDNGLAVLRERPCYRWPSLGSRFGSHIVKFPPHRVSLGSTDRRRESRISIGESRGLVIHHRAS